MMHILYVEDDPRLRRHVLHALMTHDHDVVEACNGAEACWLHAAISPTEAIPLATATKRRRVS